MGGRLAGRLGGYTIGLGAVVRILLGKERHEHEEGEKAQ